MKMKRAVKIGASVAVASVLVAGITVPAMAQRGAAQTQAPRVKQVSPRPMWGQEGAFRAGGWWLRAQPKDEAAKAHVAYVTELHNNLRTQRQELAGLTDPAAIAQKRAQIQNLLTEIQTANAKAVELGDRLGIQPGIRGMGPGRGFGMADSGWWNRVDLTNLADKAFVEKIAQLQKERRELVAGGAPADQIKVKVDEIHNLMAQNQERVQRLAPLAGRGQGQGPGLGLGPRMGGGRGAGMGPRDGTGFGPGRGLRRGPGGGMGRAMNPNCPLVTPPTQ
jgi:hypothetical protein